jgi:hypothetical protein
MVNGRAVIALVIGLAMLGYGGQQVLNQQSDVQNAIEHTGTVQNTSVEIIEKEHTASYEPSVTYSYTYDGQDYTSQSVYPGPDKRFNSKESARAVANRYATGQEVTLYVNQENPSRAFLIEESGTNLLTIFLLGFGVLIAGGSADALIRGGSESE